MRTTLPLHPFPARMAPDLALKHLPPNSKNLTILDPMMGSGTIPVLAHTLGHKAIGFDIDPLAVNIAKAWAMPLDAKRFMAGAEEVVTKSREVVTKRSFDKDTQAFMDFWFDYDAQVSLSSLAKSINSQPNAIRPALWSAFSRLIIAKDSGASRARDVSHSRPHRVRDRAEFDPRDRYIDSAKYVLKRHQELGKRFRKNPVNLGRADARQIPLADKTVDMVLTSPPYLQAIDYMRGHKLALVWMGYPISELRDIRSKNVGAEKISVNKEHDDILRAVVSKKLDGRSKGIVRQYIYDLAVICKELSRVTKTNGQITFVVAEATIKSERVMISDIITRLGKQLSWTLKDRSIRKIKSSRRYLPPPKDGIHSLDKRMREEVCLTFAI